MGHRHVRSGAPADVEEQQVEDDRDDRAEGDAGAEDDLQPGRHRLRDGRLQGDQHRQADRGRHDHRVAVVVHVDLAERLDAHDGDVGEHRQGRAAQHRRRDRGDDRAGLRQQAEDDHDDPCRGDDPARLHPGEPDQADVLGETGVREGVEDATQGGRQAVGAQRGGDVPRGDPLADDLTGGEHVAGGLDRGDRHHDDHRDGTGEGEGGPAEEERCGDADRGGARHPGEIGVAQRRRDGGADDQADEHRDGGHEALEEPLHQDDHRERPERIEQAGTHPRRVGLPPADHVAGGHADQGGAHHGEQGAGDHRREVLQQLREVGGAEEGRQPGDDDRPVDRGQPVGAATGGQADGDDRRHRREGHPLQQRETDADPSAQPGRLDDRCDAAGEQVGVDQVDGVLGRQAEALRDDQRHDDRPGIEGQDVLDAEDRQLRERKDGVDRVDGPHGGCRGCHGSILGSVRRTVPVRSGAGLPIEVTP
ncbi:hypothetical protein SDC9_104013 [bioreactor metagenome]|uniref:Uncharacterized protein n=1 Tax=bioreactor metagenome TaxID=1076179 RepID=A0A645AY07_9ZZZZ